MNDTHWRLTALEFVVLWRQFGRDRLPYPMCFRADADTDEAFRRQQRAAAQRVIAGLGEELYGAVIVLAAPTIRVEACGFDGPGLGTVTRLHAGVRAATAVLARQLPGPEPESGGDVLISLGSDDGLPERLVESLPPASRGTRRGFTPIPSSSHQGVLRPATRRLPEERSAGFFDRPRSGVGEIEVSGGAATDWRPTPDRRVLHWMDFEGDGRYLLHGTPAVAAVPASGRDVADGVRRLIGAARAAQDSTTSHTAT